MRLVIRSPQAKPSLPISFLGLGSCRIYLGSSGRRFPCVFVETDFQVASFPSFSINKEASADCFARNLFVLTHRLLSAWFGITQLHHYNTLALLEPDIGGNTKPKPSAALPLPQFASSQRPGTSNDMATASIARPAPVERSNSDISPKTTVPPSHSEPRGPKADYFSCDSNTVDGSNTSVRASDGDDGSSGHKSSVSFAADPPSVRSASLESSENAGKVTGALISRHSSISSVAFRPPKDPSLPQGRPHRMSNARIRASSPAPARYVASYNFIVVSLVSSISLAI